MGVALPHGMLFSARWCLKASAHTRAKRLNLRHGEGLVAAELDQMLI